MQEKFLGTQSSNSFIFGKMSSFKLCCTKTVDSCKGQTREIFVTILLNIPRWLKSCSFLFFIKTTFYIRFFYVFVSDGFSECFCLSYFENRAPESFLSHIFWAVALFLLFDILVMYAVTVDSNPSLSALPAFHVSSSLCKSQKTTKL